MIDWWQEDSERIVELKELLRQRKEEQMQRELHHLITQAHEAELRDKFKLSEQDIKIKAGEGNTIQKKKIMFKRFKVVSLKGEFNKIKI